MKKKLLLAICLMASVSGYAQWWSGHAENVVFDEDARTMTIKGLQAGHLGDIIVEDYGSEHINLRIINSYSWENYVEEPSYSWYVEFGPAPIETLIITGELNGKDMKLIADMGRLWGNQTIWNSYNFYEENHPADINHYMLLGGLKNVDISGAKIVKDAVNAANNIYLDVSEGKFNGVGVMQCDIDGTKLNQNNDLYDLTTHGNGAGVFSVENDNEIGDAMFIGCNTLETIILPNTTSKIGKLVFSLLKKMSEMTIPASVESIGSFAFYQAFNMSIAMDAYIASGRKAPVTVIKFAGAEDKVELEDNALTQIPPGTSSSIYYAGVESTVSLLSDYALDPVIEDNYKVGFVKGIATPPNKYWTFSSGVDVFIPDNVKVYTCQIVNGEADINEITDDLIVDEKRVIKRNNGVLVACPDNAESNAYELVAKYNADLVGTTPATDNANDYPNNSLVPVIKKAHYNPGEYYMLYHGKWVVLAGDDAKVPAGKALLKK